MLKIRFSARIQKDLKLLAKRGYDMAKFEYVVNLLGPKQWHAATIQEINLRHEKNHGVFIDFL